MSGIATNSTRQYFCKKANCKLKILVRTSLICLKWLGIKIIIYQPYSSTFLLQSLTYDIIIIHFSFFKACFLKKLIVIIFHFEEMITNIVYILKTYFFLLYFILFFWPTVFSFHAHLLALSHVLCCAIKIVFFFECFIFLLLYYTN